MSNGYAKNASKLHRLVGDTLRNSAIFGGYDIYQEYSASKVNPRLSNRLHFDWAIPRLSLVVECHGEQHYHPVTFGGVDYEVALDNFHGTQRRDLLKKDGALYGGWTYIEVKYDMHITEDTLFALYQLAQKEAKSYNEVVDKDVQPKEDTYRKEKLEKARAYRKEQYKQQKEWKKNNER